MKVNEKRDNIFLNEKLNKIKITTITFYLDSLIIFILTCGTDIILTMAK